MRSGGDRQHRRRSERDRRRWQHPEQQVHHGLDLADYLEELAEVRLTARENLAAAGERALKVLDRFLANLAHALGLPDNRVSMGDSIRYLEQIPGVPHDIAVQAERYRETRNALAHLPDLMLRPEAAIRIIDGIEVLVRMAAEAASDLSQRRIVTASLAEPLTDARDRLLHHRYDQLVVVDDAGGVVDLLTDRDIVLVEAQTDIDADGTVTVAEAIAARGHPAVALLPANSSTAEAVEALREERVGAVVLTDTGNVGELPRGIITRKDLLKAM
jgi:CBS domain-containing protein